MPRLPGQITIISVGKLRTSYWKQAQEEYQKRLRHYIRYNMVEIKDMIGHGLPDHVAVEKEGASQLKAARSAHRLIALSPAGRQMTSVKLATYLKRQVELYSHVAFLIGGPLGFSDELLINCHEQLSLSPLTLPHELARVVLMEQLYRSFTIMFGENYHK